jgi:hypothetical protein
VPAHRKTIDIQDIFSLYKLRKCQNIKMIIISYDFSFKAAEEPAAISKKAKDNNCSIITSNQIIRNIGIIRIIISCSQCVIYDIKKEMHSHYLFNIEVGCTPGCSL